MFEFVRRNTKFIAAPLFLLIIAAFVLVGIDGYKGFAGRGATVAQIGSAKITQEEWDFAHKNEVDRLRASIPNLDPKLLDSAEARYATLERLVRERVMAVGVNELHLETSDERFRRLFQESPDFASLRTPQGTLDVQKYATLAASQGLTPAGLDARIRKQVSERLLETGVTSTAFAPNALADMALNAFFERREVQIARFSPGDFSAKVNPPDADVEAYYQSHLAQFQSPESATVEYVVLDLDAVKKTVTVNEDDLKTYFKENASRFTSKEERRASHILINAPKDMPAAERQKAKEKAQALLEQVRKNPSSFAELAKKNSQDPGSAPRGGDLDFFGHGAMVKPFEDAAFALKKGDISDLVESDFGYHIIKLTDIKAAKEPKFEEARAGLEAELRAQMAQRKFAEVAETFTNGVYEQSDSLKSVAERLKLEIKQASNVQREPAADAKGVLANAKLLAAIFSPDSLEKKRNTEAVETAPNQLSAARIVSYSPAAALPLTAVRNQVREQLIASRAQELAKKEGMAKLEAWKAAPASASFPAAVTVSREPNQPVQGALLDAALRADPAKLPAMVGVDLGRQGYAIVKVSKVLPRTPVADSAAQQERNQYAQWTANAESLAYYAALKERFKVQIKVPAPAGVVPSEAQ
ncbi:peptidylprolyl isomerase [uncultured Rhodoferax sp.]|uniref:peptidylprolyl isomerase n=1 Tax=uncultured Rhodoferax sp. TaxID=223188 RepID=UPI0025F1A28F|nr:peptidylprolyl isomerase [uncultured Rhodoferax sp.]